MLPAASVRRTRPSPPSRSGRDGGRCRVVDSGIGHETIAHCARESSAGRRRRRLRSFGGWRRPCPRSPNAVPWSGLVRTCAKPKRHVHRLLEVDDLERGEALVVVEGHGNVEFAANLAAEKRVGGLAAREPRIGRPRSASRIGSIMSRSSVPMRPPSPGVGVQPADADARRGHALGPRELGRRRRPPG